MPIYVHIVDPHGTHLSDALPKVVGLREYLRDHGAGTALRGAETVAVIDGELLALDLGDETVVAALDAATSAATLYTEHGVAL